MHIKRYLNLTLPAGQSCFLWGARKAGKSTYLKEQFQDSLYLDLLQANEYQVYSKNPERLRQEI
ncbi:MAG: hypothetical protein LBH67_01120 [Rickettsia sp.]|jgi:predicted kinase|nr:hypothetical protein [Rickettsia sp.]